MPARSKIPRVVIRETRRSNGVWRTLFGVLGLGLVTLLVLFQPYMNDVDMTAPLMAFAMAFGVLVFGLAALSSWRRSEDMEAVEIQNGRLKLIVSFYEQPVFDAPLSIAQVHRFTLPKNGGTKLFLRDGQKAVEIGADMTEDDRQQLANRLDSLVAPYRQAA